MEETQRLVPWQSGPSERGTVSIIITSLAVVLTCTWTVLHLNVAPDDWKSDWKTKTLRKLKWMAVTVLFPEFYFTHAVLELKTALDDYFLMVRHEEAMFRVGWCVHADKRLARIHSLLSGDWLAGGAGDPPAVDTVINPPTDRPEDTLELEPLSSQARGRAGRQTPPVVPTERLESAIDTASEHSGAGPEVPDWSMQLVDRMAGIPFEHPLMCREMQCQVWTLRHCFLVNMGGLELSEAPRRSQKQVRTDTLVNTLQTDDKGRVFSFIRLTEKDINDRDKSDVFVRLLALLQIIRLVISMIVRAVRQLPIAQIEIFALSFSLVSIASFIVQLPKPKDVSEPMEFPVGSLVHSLNDEEDIPVDRLIPAMILGSSPARAPRRRGYGRVRNDSFRPFDRSVEFFAILSGLSSLLFGPFHIIAWNSQFPTSTEQWMWRITSLIVTLLPLSWLVLVIGISRVLKRFWHSIVAEFPKLTDCIQLLPEEIQHDIARDCHLRNKRNQANEESVAMTVMVLEVAAGRFDDEALARLEEAKKAAAQVYQRTSKYARLVNYRVLIQMPVLVIYFVARIVLFVLALLAFRSAPAGIYIDTWAGFLPAIS